jgi:hypothetical protein
VFAFLGDEQSSPHFMRCSDLTGAAINSMLFNDFLGTAIQHFPFLERFCTNIACAALVCKEMLGTGGGVFVRSGFSLFQSSGDVMLYTQN